MYNQIAKAIVVMLHVWAIFGEKNQPNIVLIIADDMGWNDVGFHGSNQIPTPNIDALGYNGIILNRFYTQQTCTPSRTALLTGNYPIRSGKGSCSSDQGQGHGTDDQGHSNGKWWGKVPEPTPSLHWHDFKWMQGYPLKAGENRHLPLDMPTMPEQMKRLGYKTHLLGKWHLGYAYKKVTPTARGFDSHFGYWNGYVGYFDYKITQDKFKGFDLRHNFDPHLEARGQYATELFTQKATEIIQNHNKSEPLFLMVSHLAPHAGKGGSELEVPDINLTNTRFSYISNGRRRLYADIVNRLDTSVGQIVKELSDENMLENSIVVFISDNGGQTIGMHENSASNWPLRGLKFTLLEGGVRGVGALFSPLLQQRGIVNDELMHISDWLPTFYAAAGGNVRDLGKLDGVNQWDVLTKNEKTSRSEILLDYDEKLEMSAIISYGGKYKLVNGTHQDGIYDQYYGESGRTSENPEYNKNDILNSDTHIAIQKMALPNQLTPETILKLRSRADISNCRGENPPEFVCKGVCLFDLQEDACETRNVAQEHPDIVRKLSEDLSKFSQELVAQGSGIVDPRSNPEYFNGIWSNWLHEDEVLNSECSKDSNHCHIE